MKIMKITATFPRGQWVNDVYSESSKVLQLQSYNIDGLAQDCSKSIANALELLQFCTKPLTCIVLLL